MLITDGILESLIQDGKTIDLIRSYLYQCCRIDISLDELKKYINNLYTEQLILIAFPLEYAELKQLNDADFEIYWFELSKTAAKAYWKISAKTKKYTAAFVLRTTTTYTHQAV